jgi:hypothetical protein
MAFDPPCRFIPLNGYNPISFQRLKQKEVSLHGDQLNYDVNNPCPPPRFPGTEATGNRLRVGLILGSFRKGHEGIGNGSQGSIRREYRE